MTDARQCSNCGSLDRSVGEVCQHLVHGQLLTFFTAPADDGMIPDTACSRCFERYHELGDVPAVWDEMSLHAVCRACYDELRSRHICPSAIDMERRYSIVSRAQYYRVHGRPEPVVNPQLGTHAKLALSPIPSQYPLSVERMWFRVLEVRSDTSCVGTLDNDPNHFDPDVLKDGDRIEFRIEDILEIME